MVPADLSRAGWSCASRNPARSQCVIEGAHYDSSEIQGILIRRRPSWPRICPTSLFPIGIMLHPK